ncbi:Serine/threonine-protein kinase/endoribonuclease IRE2 [Orchesella cincta]|uniref:non-specific serine/threonine protein kinase n=1 Tax=Orchesella cincta TaxID=48709 RepID=A0A1D2MSU1_ORCCI|nr:Serine/threonine-protein kinase/endoribonuclease IRE2 [Orchesella cincta]
MEQWQKEIIQANLPDLIGNTICNCVMLAEFSASGILSQCDIEALKSHEDNSAKSYSFYTILMKKRDAFPKLLEVLQETKQTGSLYTLLTGAMERKNKGLGEIKLLTYDENAILGEGSHGTVVYKGQFSGRNVAVKRINNATFNAKENATLMQEVDVLQACDSHENIVRYFGSSLAINHIFIALELCDITLKDWVASKTINIQPLEVLRQVTVGLEWLHSKQFIHRDLKPENILLTHELSKVKLSDFGLSRRVANGKSYALTAGFGTEGWVAPEILSQAQDGYCNQIKFTYKSDIFALGCICYYVLTDGKHAFGDHFRRTANILDGKLMVKETDLIYAIPQNIKVIELMVSNEPTDMGPSDDKNKMAHTNGNFSTETCLNTLICRLAYDDITMGHLNAAGEVELIKNLAGEFSTRLQIGQTRQNELVCVAALRHNYFVKSWTLRDILANSNHEVLYEGKLVEMTLEFFLGQMLKILKPFAESKTCKIFNKIIIAVPVPFMWGDTANELQTALKNYAGFDDAKIVTEISCLARSYVKNNYPSEEQELLVLSQNFTYKKYLIGDINHGVDVGLYKCRPDSEIEKNPQRLTLENCLVGTFQNRKPRSVVIACDLKEQYEKIKGETARYDLIVHTFPNHKLEIIKGAVLSLSIN